MNSFINVDRRLAPLLLEDNGEFKTLEKWKDSFNNIIPTIIPLIFKDKNLDLYLERMIDAKKKWNLFVERTVLYLMPNIIKILRI
jgi:hypothetical protein